MHDHGLAMLTLGQVDSLTISIIRDDSSVISKGSIIDDLSILVLVGLEVDFVKDSAKGGDTEAHLWGSLLNNGGRSDFDDLLLADLLTAGLSKDRSGGLVMAVGLAMAARVKVGIDHVGGRGTDRRVDLLGGHRDVVRVERGLVKVRVAVVRVPVGLSRALSLQGGSGSMRVAVSGSSLSDHNSSQSQQQVYEFDFL